MIKYLYETRNLKLMLSACNVGIIHWLVDASYAIHEDCKVHTGSMMTLGSGAVTSFSRKQKINAQSSTEAELIAMDGQDMLWNAKDIK